MKKAYQEMLGNKQLECDPAQAEALAALDNLSMQLITRQSSPFKFKGNIQGLYFHGRVGRGKTMLMDLFYQHLPLERKKRIHFHHFMESIHQQLTVLTGQSEPLTRIAEQWSKKIDVLCFDEFFVNDIGDAMLLSGLFSAFFSQGITLVATSNCKPEQLYRNGLQRERFLPTITLINQYCQIVSIDGQIDHRRSQLTENSSHKNYYLLDQKGDKKLLERYQALSGSQVIVNGEIEINHRLISYIANGLISPQLKSPSHSSSHSSAIDNKLIYFDFFALCSGPRSQRDYMSIAKQYDTVLIANVPKFSGRLVPAVFSGVEDSYQRSGVLMGELQQLDDEARRFIALVDEFYDQGVKLIVSAEVGIFELYQGQQLAFEFERCQSRLVEMQQLDC